MTKQIEAKDKSIQAEKVQSDSVLHSVKEEKDKTISELKEHLNKCESSNKMLKDEITIAGQELSDMESFMMGAVEYLTFPEYEPSVLKKALQARIKNEVLEEKRVQAGNAIAMLDPEFEEMQEDLKKLAIIKSEKRDPGTLFEIGRSIHTDKDSRHEVWRSLAMLFGWNRPYAIFEYRGGQWEQGIRMEVLELKRRPDQEILHSIRISREQKLSLQQQQARVRDDNERASKLMIKISSYRQCSHCLHASHIRRTKGATCYHCGQTEWGPQALKWLPIDRLTGVPNCSGNFPCQKPSLL